MNGINRYSIHRFWYFEDYRSIMTKECRITIRTCILEILHIDGLISPSNVPNIRNISSILSIFYVTKSTTPKMCSYKI